ncbi:MAG: hypothetical protein ACYC55_05935 [Candidatus Geothermincolia bacterium]
MRIRRNEIIPLGYGKYVRSDRIIEIEPIEKDRGPARRTLIVVDGKAEPVVASRSSEAILRDIVERSDRPEGAIALSLLEDMLRDMEKVGPMLRRSIRDEASLDIDELTSRIRGLLSGRGKDNGDQGELFK